MRPEATSAEQDKSEDKPTSPFAALLAASGKAGAQPAQQPAGRCVAEGVGTSEGDKSGDTATSSGVSENIRGDGYAREECSGVRHDARGSGGGEAGSAWRAAKRQRMVWTAELHERFLNAVNHLGLKNAVPKTILRMMNVDGMTRENVASHLQKYRLHLKRQAAAQERAAAPAAAPAPPAAPPATGVPLPLLPGALPAAARAGTALGVPVCGVPVCAGLAGLAGVPASMAHIPPQAWSAGVPGYDALRVLQSLSAAAARPGGAAALPPASAAPAAAAQPVLDIAPLSTAPAAPPASSAATG